jgi:hypothetical protein
MTRAFCVLPVLWAVLQAGCYWLPAKERLVGTFQLHRPLFDTLIKMAEEDSQFRRVSGGEIPPRGMPVSRYQEYVAIFRAPGIENGLTRDLSPAGSGVYSGWLRGADRRQEPCPWLFLLAYCASSSC